MFEKKTQLASVSVRFNAHLRAWVTGTGAVRWGPAGTLFRSPPATEDPDTERLAHSQLETPRGRRVF